MSDRWRWLKHAFAVEGDTGPAEPENDEQRELIDRFCREVAKRHLTTPGVFLLETLRPVHYVSSQVLGRFMIRPYVWMLSRDRTVERYDDVLVFLEKRGAFEYICGRIEHFEAEFERREKAARAEHKARKRKRKATGEVQQLSDEDVRADRDPPPGT